MIPESMDHHDHAQYAVIEAQHGSKKDLQAFFGAVAHLCQELAVVLEIDAQHEVSSTPCHMLRVPLTCRKDSGIHHKPAVITGHRDFKGQERNGNFSKDIIAIKPDRAIG